MRSRARRIRALIKAAMPVFIFLSCESSTEPPGDGDDNKNAVASIDITAQGSTNLSLGGTVQLQATPRNAQNEPVTGQTITWTSQNNQVAQVSGVGLVTGAGVGSTQITASAGGKSGHITITVANTNPPGTPANLVASPVSDTRIDLSWSPASGTVTSYRIEREVVGGAAVIGVEPPAAAFVEIATVPGNTTQYSDTGLEPDATYRYRVGACNANGCSAFSSQTQTTTFEALVIETASLPAGVVAKPYAAQLDASGGDGSPAWSIVSGSLPPGLALAGATGVISGTPEDDGTYEFTVRAVGGGQTVERDLSISVEPPQAVVIETTTLPDGIVGEPYDQTLQATGGDGVNYAWSIANGMLPAGLALDGLTGTIAGTPVVPGTSNFTIRVESDGDTDTQPLSITVTSPPVEIGTASLPAGTVGVPYSQTLAVSGGDGQNYEWSVTTGNLPNGLSLDDATGQISGTPASAGSFGFIVQVESGGQSDTQALAITIAAAQPVVLDNWYLVPGFIGQAYSYAVEASGGNGLDYTFSHTGGTLPPGMMLNADGTITGSPGGTGTFFFEVTVQSGGAAASRVYALTISTNAKSGFNIAIVNGNGTMPPPALVTALNEAINVWEGAITSDFGAFVMPGEISGAGCKIFVSDVRFRPGEVIEDLAIMLFVRSIDGQRGTIAQAGGCGFFQDNMPTGRLTTGTFTMDSNDVPTLAGNPDRFRTVAVHEIGHVLGLGESRWQAKGLIVGNGVTQQTPCGANPRYIGVNGVAGYHSVGGLDDDIPVEDEGGQGTCDSHWRESEFTNEVMTGIIQQTGPWPLSIMTLRALEDLWYTTDHGVADPYVLGGGAVVDGAREGGEEPGIWLGDDVWEAPGLVVQPDGTVIEVSPPSWER